MPPPNPLDRSTCRTGLVCRNERRIGCLQSRAATGSAAVRQRLGQDGRSDSPAVAAATHPRAAAATHPVAAAATQPRRRVTHPGQPDRGRRVARGPHCSAPNHPGPSAGSRGGRTAPLDTHMQERVQSPHISARGTFSTDGPETPAARLRRHRDSPRRRARARSPAPACRGIPAWQARGHRTRAYRPDYRLPVGGWGQAEIAPQGATDVEPPWTLAGTGGGRCCVRTLRRRREGEHERGQREGQHP